MSLLISFNRAASAEFSEATAWYESKRIVAQRFPFSVYFRAQIHRIVVLAVLHGRRDPTIWLDRT